MIFLVDGDNNIGTGLKGIELLSETDTVLVFYQKGLALTKIKKLCAASRADVQYIESVKGGKNSIDFQIITELGVLVGKRAADFAYVISQDKGYAPSIEVLRTRYADAFQEVALHPSIEECLPLSFILKVTGCRELCDALTREYGKAQGQMLYNHLKRIFASPEEAVKAPGKPPVPLNPAKPVEKAPDAAGGAIKVTRSRRGGRRKKPAEKPAEKSAAAE